MLKKLWANVVKYLKSCKGEIGEAEFEELKEKNERMEAEIDTLKDDKETLETENKAFKEKDSGGDVVQEKKIQDLSVRIEASEKREKDTRSELNVAKIGKEFPKVDISLIGNGTYEEMKGKAEKLNEFREKTIEDAIGKDGVRLQDEFRKVPGIGVEFHQGTVKSKEVKQKIEVAKKEGSLGKVFDAITEAVGLKST